MKNERHNKILEIITKYPITTQDELLSFLKNEGYDVTQSTVSRDIKQLKLHKTHSQDGKYCYTATFDKSKASKGHLQSLFSTSVVSVVNAQNIVVIKTDSGMAQAICATLDSIANDDVVGTIAGEDTIMAICKDEESARNYAQDLSNGIVR